jgi:hypothetical protein
VGNEVQFLMDDGDACGFRFKRGGKADRLAAIMDRPPIRLIDAADDFHQGRFASAVLAADSMNLARPQFEADVRQGLDARKLLGN